MTSSNGEEPITIEEELDEIANDLGVFMDSTVQELKAAIVQTYYDDPVTHEIVAMGPFRFGMIRAFYRYCDIVANKTA
jgi:hypothetical protein